MKVGPDNFYGSKRAMIVFAVFFNRSDFFADFFFIPLYLWASLTFFFLAKNRTTKVVMLLIYHFFFAIWFIPTYAQNLFILSYYHAHLISSTKFFFCWPHSVFRVYTYICMFSGFILNKFRHSTTQIYKC